MTSEGLGEMSEGDSADMCAGKFPLVSMGGRAEGLCAQTRERGPPSSLAEICTLFSCPDISHSYIVCYLHIFSLFTFFPPFLVELLASLITGCTLLFANI